MGESAHRESAFTRIELGAVIALTAILAAVAVSAIRTYRVRHQVTEGLGVAMSFTRQVGDFFRRHGEVPAGLSALPEGSDALAGSSPFVESVAVIDGRIVVLYGGAADAAIAGGRLSLTPYETADMQIVWICGNDIPGPGLEPLGFAGGGRQPVQAATTIEARYLAPLCR